MPLTHSDWQSILHAIGKSVGQSSIQHARVIRVDEKKQKVWLEGLGPDPIDFAAWDYRVKTVDPHDDGRVEYQDIEIAMPQKGDSVLVARSMGARELARIIAPLQFDPTGVKQGKKNFVNTQGEFWPGMMMDFCGLLDHTKTGPIDPFGDGKWLYCNGAAVKRSEYTHLFKRIGTRYGNGDGSTTFNLPDYRGRVAVSRGTDFAAIGATGGAKSAILAAAHMPQHTHTTPNHTHAVTTSAHTHTISSDGLHQHGMLSGYSMASIHGADTGSPWKGTTGAGAPWLMAESLTNQQGSHSHGGATGSGGGGSGNTDNSGGGTTGPAGSASPTAVDTMPPYEVDGGKIIRVRR